MSETIRLQKFLAGRGVAARRPCGEIIKAGRVTVNGTVVTEPWHAVDPGQDIVNVDGRPLEAPKPAARTLMLNKPRGYLCSTTSAQGESVLELIPEPRGRLVPVGRLDKDSEGLLLLSNDGELTQRMTAARYGHRKTYQVTVSGTVDARVLERLREPIVIEGYRTRPAEVRLLRAGNTPGRQVLEFVLGEGRNRQIRRLCEGAGLRIHRLVRTAVGPLRLGGLRPGQWRELTGADVAGLMGDREEGRGA